MVWISTALGVQELEFVTGTNCMVGKEGFIELGLEDLKEQIG